MLYFALFLATVFVLIFAVSFTWQLTHPEYEIPAGIYPILTITTGGIIGYVFKKGTSLD
jgi:hypothetical protein